MYVSFRYFLKHQWKDILCAPFLSIWILLGASGLSFVIQNQETWSYMAMLGKDVSSYFLTFGILYTLTLITWILWNYDRWTRNRIQVNLQNKLQGS
jgi:hypothetical protein